MPRKEAASRDRILSIATEEFAGYGFAGARIDRIARRVKLNVRMIYYHFKHKKGLYRAVLQEIYTRIAATLVHAAQVQDLGRRPIEAMERYVDLLVQHPRFAEVLLRELLDGGVHLKALFAAEPTLFEIVHEPAIALMRDATRTRTFRDVPPQETVLAMVATVLVCLATRDVQPIFIGRKPQVAEWKAILTDLFLNGLRPR